MTLRDLAWNALDMVAHVVGIVLGLMIEAYAAVMASLLDRAK